jgi:predicted transcriptional regulator
MDANQAVDTLAALAQETRLRIFRLLVEQGRQGLHAGAIAETLAASSQRARKAASFSMRRASRRWTI